MIKLHDGGTVDGLSLTVNVSLDGKTTSIPLLRKATIPEPSCHNTELSYALPGDGTVEGFARALGNSVGESAVELVLNYLGIKVNFKKLKEYACFFGFVCVCVFLFCFVLFLFFCLSHLACDNGDIVRSQHCKCYYHL